MQTMNSSPQRSSRMNFVNSLPIRSRTFPPTADSESVIDPDRFQEQPQGRPFRTHKGSVNFSYHCLDAKERFDNNHNLLVYGNPLWAEEQNPVLKNDAIVIADDAREGLTAPLLLEYPLAVSSPQHDHLSFSLDSSDGEDQEAFYGNAKFWNSCRFNDVRSRSTSKSSSVYDLDSSTESKDYSDKEAMQEQRDTREMNTDCSRKTKRSERQPETEKAEIDVWSMKSPGSVSKEYNTSEEIREGDEVPSEHAMERECGQPVGNYEIFQPTDKQLYGFTADGNNNKVTKCRNSILWSFEGFKKDLRTLSPQDEDFLYRNSDILASFEVEERLNPNDNINDNFNRHGATELYEDQCENSLFRQYATFKPASPIDYSCQTDCIEEEQHKNVKTSEFDDTSPWTTNNSECIDSEQLQFDATRRNFNSLSMQGEALKNESCIGEMDEILLPTNMLSSSVSCASDEGTKNSSVHFHEISKNESKSQQQAFNVIERKTKETNMATVVNGLEAEVERLKMENRRLEKLLKENEHKMAEFSKERALWEQKKLSEMNIFNAFKEEEVQRLRKERSRLEKQAKLLAQLPTKKERSEIEELRKKIANIASDHVKKESLQNLTINRLRRTIADLTEQIRSLEEEVKRYERFLQAEWGTDSRRMSNLQQVSLTEKFPTIDYGKDTEITRKLQHGDNLNKVSTPMFWTRPQQ